MDSVIYFLSMHLYYKLSRLENCIYSVFSRLVYFFGVSLIPVPELNASFGASHATVPSFQREDLVNKYSIF